MYKIILLPGMDGSGIMFGPLIQLISNRYDYEVIALHQLDDQSYESQAEFVANRIGDESVILFAESYSGYIALLISRLKPHNIKHIIFAASFIQILII